MQDFRNGKFITRNSILGWLEYVKGGDEEN